ncbi:MAG: hypothetical protein Ct9H300mP32_4710 [Verrucomicrobiota bacterium]|nr:MAG: hypothetical protein Ct9H300mP32_4710 [Verrucomicrobiota bacterium]
MRAAFTEVENDDHRPAGVVCEGMFFTLAIGQFPLGRVRGTPAKRAKRVERRPLTDIVGRLEFNAPIFRQAEFHGDGCQSLEDGALDV